MQLYNLLHIKHFPRSTREHIFYQNFASIFQKFYPLKSKLLSDYLGIKKVSAFGINDPNLVAEICENLLKNENSGVNLFLYPGALSAENYSKIQFIEPKIRKIEL